MDSEDNRKKPLDIYRETPLRLLGYANEVGEAFRPLVSKKIVLGSYGVALAYVCADTVDKTLKTHRQEGIVYHRSLQTAYTACDTLTWQILASVAIPGFTINRIVAASMWVMKKKSALGKQQRKFAAAMIGLAMIPFIVQPIDRLVDMMLDKSLRKFRPT